MSAKLRALILEDRAPATPPLSGGGGIWVGNGMVARNTIFYGNTAPNGPDIYGNVGSKSPLWAYFVLRDFLEGGPIVAKKLYVGNLSYGMTDSDLQSLFGPHGTVQSAQVIVDRDAGRSKGFGFVEMGSGEEAQAAIAALNGQDVNGRALTVNEARPREKQGGSHRDFGGYQNRSWKCDGNR